MEAKIVRKNPNVQLPSYKHREGDACCDLHANEDYELAPGTTALIKTGLYIEIPNGYTLMVCSRSGMALSYNVFVLNAPGIIDPDYRGEIGVILHNAGQLPYYILKGDRIAQGLFVKTEYTIFKEVQSLSETDRGTGGFGSTGK